MLPCSRLIHQISISSFCFPSNPHQLVLRFLVTSPPLLPPGCCHPWLLIIKAPFIPWLWHRPLSNLSLTTDLIIHNLESFSFHQDYADIARLTRSNMCLNNKLQHCYDNKCISCRSLETTSAGVTQQRRNKDTAEKTKRCMCPEWNCSTLERAGKM